MRSTLMAGVALLTSAAACATPVPPAAATATAQHSFGPEISAEDFSAHVRTLSGDDFAGRSPGGIGETKTVEYLIAQLQRLGLQPGNNGSWTQDVPMTETKADDKTSTFTLTTAKQTLAPTIGPEVVVGTRTGQPEVSIDGSELVFVGYGVNAPEAGWNDYDGLDVKGKTVVMLINDPGFHVGSTELFGGKRMTYYGRWTYKFEEAARQGAAAALIIHDDAGAAYPWEVVQNSWGGPQFDLPPSEDPEPRLPAQGWINAATATTLFADAGLDFEAMRTAANQPGFKAVPLKATFSLSLKSSSRSATSQNVIAMLPGTTHPDEAIVYTAHWDHLGRNFSGVGDRIFNGAIDNATGVAGVLEIAEAFTVQRPAPERSMVFLFVTLEESGLLGSKYYAAHPAIPLEKTVAVINLDAMSVIGPSKELVVIGLGNSTLDDVARPFAEAQDRVLMEESEPQNGYFFRSDHFNFAKAGVPALYAKGGVDHREKGREYGLAWMTDYTAVRYHKVGDNYDASWDLRGTMQDLKLLYDVGRTLGGNREWPNYVEGNAFRKTDQRGQ
ncbi:M28 family metallopeptidase [Silanimonas sp.]|uniref:M28 family metallopeptidase n=1 Tax=Silanimonas sp. TaxID=1929290 RepID=UPI0022C01EB4|nr:M28 family metallopeptidase [Silanimonas sp.]MCZ8164450.1 M28 family metallopeptidase [Silanimonas sp.]